MIRIEKRLAIWLTFFVSIIDTKTRRPVFIKQLYNLLSHLKRGEYLPFSIATMVCLETPTASANVLRHFIVMKSKFSNGITELFCHLLSLRYKYALLAIVIISLTKKPIIRKCIILYRSETSGNSIRPDTRSICVVKNTHIKIIAGKTNDQVWCFLAQ